MPESRFDIAIVGGGPVGMATAAMLVGRGMPGERIAVIDAKSAQAAQQDPRSLALSYGSRQLLEQVHAWPADGTAITGIHVSRRGSFGRTLIEAAEYGLPALGHVCRYGSVVRALDEALLGSGIHMLRPARVEGFSESADGVQLELDGERMLQARLLVQAEGGVYGEQSIRNARQRDYRQTAVIATVHSTAAPPGRAFERFTDEGPLALLPQQGSYSLVWCVRPQNAEPLMALDDADFLSALQQAFGQRAGRFTQVSPRHAYALGLNAEAHATARTIAIGNAAQTLHPVAGQGLNLGLRDASVLAALLARAPSPESLAQFTRERRRDRSATIGLTDLMARVFTRSEDRSTMQSLLGLSLGVIDVLPFAKRMLAEQMMFGSR